MNTNESYLVIESPRTTNGVNPVIVDGKQQYKTATAPLSAKRHLDIQNKNLPDHLKKIIRIIPAVKEEKAATKK